MNRRAFLKGAPLAGAAATSGCSSDGIASPTPGSRYPKVGIRVTCAETGNPIPGAVIQTRHPGQYETDTQGIARVDFSSDWPCEIRAEGYYFRETCFQVLPQKDKAYQVTLWKSHGEEQYLRPLAYREKYSRRVAGYAVGLKFAENYTPSMKPTHEEGAHALETALNGKLKVRVDSDDAPVVFQVVMDPNDETFKDPRRVARTYLAVVDNVIVGGRIVYRNLDYLVFPELITHELGHVAGLHHCAGPDMAMDPDQYHFANGFSFIETRVLNFLYSRPPGMEYMDNDRNMLNPVRR